jgi:dihydrofolate synthase/folylpolyglutamate synthase
LPKAVADELIFTVANSSRALRPEALAELAGRGEPTPDIAAAVAAVRSRASPDDAVMITGSLFLVGEARALFVQ